MAILPPPAARYGDPFAPGTMLGKYELLATIGQGGMASVILARQRGPAGFEKVVVIKVVHPHMAQDRIAVDMLLDEARVAAQIAHPNVVQTYELGEAHGTFYIVMEYLAGESLNQILTTCRRGQQPLHPLHAARIIADVADGLHAAHELRDFNGKSLDIVHRDVSPGNIVVLYNGTVKIVDFGIAKAHGRVTSTQDGELKGKYGYMSPEQIRNEPMDRRSDVFSLGVVLWESLALLRLFHADSVGASLLKILTGERVPPSRHRPDIPPGLDAIALNALAPDPDHRFQTAAQMKQAIEDVIWQARIGAADIQAYMTATCADRMEQRRSLLARATTNAVMPSELQQGFAALEDDVSRPVSPPSLALGYPVRATAAPAPRRLRILPVMIGAILIGVIAAVAMVGSDEGSEPASTASAAQPAGVPVGSAEPTEPTEPTEAAGPTEPAGAPGPIEPAGAATTRPPTIAGPEAPSATPNITAAAPVTPTAPPVRPVITRPVVKQTGTTRAPLEPKARVRDSGDEPAVKLSASELYQRGTELYLAGKFADAEVAYKQAARRGYPAAHRGLGFLYQRTGERARALASLRTYLKLVPTAKDAAAVRQRIEQLGG